MNVGWVVGTLTGGGEHLNPTCCNQFFALIFFQRSGLRFSLLSPHPQTELVFTIGILKPSSWFSRFILSEDDNDGNASCTLNLKNTHVISKAINLTRMQKHTNILSDDTYILTRKHSGRMRTARLPTVPVLVVGFRYLPPGYLPYPDTYLSWIPTPFPRRDLGPEIPTGFPPIREIEKFWKHFPVREIREKQGVLSQNQGKNFQIREFFFKTIFKLFKPFNLRKNLFYVGRFYFWEVCL